MPMGMGSDFAPGPTPLGGQPGVGDERRGSSSSEAAREMERRGSLDAAMRKVPTLTDAQKDQLKSSHQAFRDANKDFFTQVKATRQEAHAAREANDTAKLDALKPTIESQRAHMQELRDQEHTQFLSVLTPDQKAQLDQLEAQWKAKHEGQPQH